MLSIKKLTAMILSAALLTGSQVSAAESDAKPVKKIVINAASRTLSLYEGNNKLGLYPLGLGKPSTPTPVGYYKVNTKEIDPPWIDPSNPEYEVPSGAGNPLGYRWMQIWGNYGIHGTNRPDSIGYYVSNGCIRMREADVEDLFDRVDIGTPVEITYNRVVVEKTADDQIVYYIYPDGYGWQSIDAAYVNRWLAPYGVSAFESDEDIRQKIYDSDGEPTYIGKAYPIEINGKRVENWEQNGRTFDSKAVVRSGITYLPAVPIAMAIKTKLEWRSGAATLRTAYGEVVGFERKKQIYFNADDAIVLFNLDGGLQNKTYTLKTVEQPIVVEEPKEKKKKPKKGEEEKQSVETPSVETKPIETQPIDEKVSEPVEEKASEPIEEKAIEEKASETIEPTEKISEPVEEKASKSGEDKKSSKKKDKKSAEELKK